MRAMLLAQVSYVLSCTVDGVYYHVVDIQARSEQHRLVMG